MDESLGDESLGTYTEHPHVARETCPLVPLVVAPLGIYYIGSLWDESLRLILIAGAQVGCVS